MLLGIIIGAIAVILFALLIYPGELSMFGPRANRWLYNLSAKNYQDKWRSAAYQDDFYRDKILCHLRDSITTSGVNSVLDLGCGTGRGIRLSGGVLPADTLYTGIDFSSEMLSHFQQWLSEEGKEVASQVQLVEAELGEWATQAGHPQYGMVFLLEVGEFLPAFVSVVERLASLIPPGGGLIMTRPARFWWVFFPGRRQSRRALSQLLESQGFDCPEFMPWRSRYELVLARKPN